MSTPTSTADPLSSPSPSPSPPADLSPEQYDAFHFRPGFLVPTLGIQLLAVIFSMYLLGVFSVQMQTYFRKYSHDPWVQKSLVLVLCLAGIIHWCIAFWPLWMSQVYFWGVCLDCGVTVHIYSMQVMLNSLIVLVVQLWFLRRLWLLTKEEKNFSYYMTVPILLLNLAQCGSGLYVYGKDFNGWPWVLESKLALVLWNGTIVQASIGLIADLALAGFLWFQLRKCRTGNKATDKVLEKAIHLTMVTTAITSVILILTIVSFLVAPWESFGPACNILLNHVYANCFMYALNSRPTGRSARRAEDMIKSEMSYTRTIERHGTLTSMRSIYTRRSRALSEPFTPLPAFPSPSHTKEVQGFDQSRGTSFSTHRTISEESEDDKYMGLAV